MIDIFNINNTYPKPYFFIGVLNKEVGMGIRAYSIRGWLMGCGHFMSDDAKPDWVKCSC